MKVPLVYNTTTVAVAIGVIILSTAVLSYLSYHYTVGRENLVETSLVQSNINLAKQTVDRIEQKIVDNDRILYEMADVNEPSKWPAVVDAIKKADSNVDQVWFLRPDTGALLYPPYSASIANLWNAFRASFKVKELNLERIGIDQTHHLHRERPEHYFFASYVMKEDHRGAKVLVCFQMNNEKIIALLDKYLRDFQPSYYVSIVDYENNGVYLQPVSRSGKYYYEMRFPSTFYKWILQVLPRNYTEIEQNVRNQRRTDLFFIILSMILIFSSLGIIYVAGRRERQLAQLQEDFISHVSHELKTPLSLIRMFSEVLVAGKVKNDETKQEYFGIIHRESDRMSRLIENLLDFASLERDARGKHFEKTDIAQLVSQALEAYRHEIQQQGFQLTVVVAPDLPVTLADPNAVAMAFFNLLDNSVKYSGEKKEIVVRVLQSNGYIDLSVTDKGLGISLAEQQKIFDKFYRGSNAAVKMIRGSGIGLSITKRVAELHGGDVLVKSEPGAGSTFTLRIPIRKPPDLASGS